MRRDDRRRVDVAEERDLAADTRVDGPVGAADDEVGLDTDAAQLLDGVLGRLGLELARRRDIRDERDVDVADVVAPDVLAQLADRFEERQGLDVADRAADLGDDHVGLRLLGQAEDAVLDLVGHVRDDLDRAAEEVAAALLA